jgi:hypothetical protein
VERALAGYLWGNPHPRIVRAEAPSIDALGRLVTSSRDDGVAHRPGVLLQSSPMSSDGGWLAV